MLIKTPVILSSEMCLLFASLIVLMPVFLGCSLLSLAGEAAIAVWSDSGLHEPTKRFSCGCSVVCGTAAHMLGKAGLHFVFVFFEECAQELDFLMGLDEELLSRAGRVCFLCNSFFAFFFFIVSAVAMHTP